MILINLLSDNDMIRTLRYPEDRFKIGLLSIEGFQVWYAAQDAQWLTIHADSDEFKRFVRLAYTWKLKLLRFYYKIKQIPMKSVN